MVFGEGSIARPLAPPWRRFVRGLAEELGRDRLIFGLIFAYVTLAAIVAAVSGVGPWIVAIYLPMWLIGLLLVAGVWTILVELPPAIRAEPARPLRRLLGALPERLTPRVVAGVGLYVAVALFYGAFTFFKTSMRVVPFHADPPLAALDAALHGGVDPWRLLHPILGHEPVTRAIEVIYSPVWVFLLFATPLLMCCVERCAHLRRRFLLAFIACWVLLGNILAVAFMSAGPIFYEAVTGDAVRYGGLIEHLQFSRGLKHSAIDLSHYLWAWHQSGRPGFGSGISAFPSLHVAMATLFCLTLLAVRPAATWIGLAFLAVILAGSVHLAWHYAVDGYVSILATLLIWKAAGAVDRRLAARSGGAGGLAAA